MTLKEESESSLYVKYPSLIEKRSKSVRDGTLAGQIFWTERTTRTCTIPPVYH